MILIITNESDYTADFLILGLKSQGLDFFRFNTENFPTKISLSIKINRNNIDGSFISQERNLSISEIDSIWYRRPKQARPDPEITDVAAQEFIITESKATLDNLWELLDCYWMSHPRSIRRAELKLHQLIAAANIGFTTPLTLITNNPQDATKFYSSHNQVIYKPLRHSRISRETGFSLIYTNVVTEKEKRSFEDTELSPSMFQAYINKATEIRVVVVEQQVFAVELHSQEINEARHDWRRVDATKIRHVPHRVPQEVTDKCVKLVEYFDLAFSSIDLILTPEGEYIFLELNPNGQWAWVQQMCPSLDIRQAIINALCTG